MGNRRKRISNLEKINTLPASAAPLGNPNQEMPASALGVRKKEFTSKFSSEEKPLSP